MLLRHLSALCLPLVVATSALAQLAPAPAPFVALQPRLVVSGVVVSGATDQPIRLGAVEVAVELTPNAAETRIQMRFDNPNARILEGELQFPLAAGQSVVGFALDIDGTLRDAVPVDKPKAQAIFEDIQRVRIDPGLLERTQGNNYKLRVYPIPPRGSRTVVIRIAEALAPRAGQIDYMLPVLGAQGVERYTLNVTANGFALAPAFVGAPGLTFA
ncbi:MAG: VIT domain-containing protein, partial [Burkholderiales bacterium]